jgi:hypothetical protein
MQGDQQQYQKQQQQQQMGGVGAFGLMHGLL